MNSWVRLVQCRQTPTQIYTIYDYTKIAYLIDSGICIREIVSENQKPIFIPIEHQYEKVCKIFWVSDQILMVQKTTKQTANIFTLNFYAPDRQCQTYKIYWQNDAISEIFCVQNQNILILAGSCFTQQATQILFFDCHQKSFIAKGIFEGLIQQVALGPNDSISILSNNHITAYKNEYVQQGVGRIYRDCQYSKKGKQIKHHIWIEGQLLIWNDKQIEVIVDRKQCQTIAQFHRLHKIIPLICGFIACDSCMIKMFKKKGGQYQLISQLNQDSLIDCSNFMVSPQQDIVAFYSKISSGIIYSTKIQQQIDQNPYNRKIISQSIYLKTKDISHQKSFQFCMYSSQQNIFAATNSSEVQLYSTNLYSPYLSLKIQEQQYQKMNVFDSGIKIRCLAIHPNRPIIAVALKKVVRIYYVTFNEVKLLKQLQVSMCGCIVFNNSGSMLSTIVGGKNGAKINIYRIDEQKNQFNLLQTMSVPKKVQKMFWNTLDNKFLCIFYGGIYQWDTLTKFKQRKQYLNITDFEINDGYIYEKYENGERSDFIILWGVHQAVIMQGQQIIQKFNTPQNIEIKSIMYAQNMFIFVTKDGRICQSKFFDLQAGLKYAYDLKSYDQDFDIQLQQDSRLIYTSKKCNTKFFEFGKKSNEFSEYVGIEKKKIVSLLGKYRHYQQTIKSLRESFSNTIIEIKTAHMLENQQRQALFTKQLQQHKELGEKIKDQKSRLEQMMENNLKVKQLQAMKQVKDLQKLYDRKIALTTNKLLTEKQIGFRDKKIADSNLKKLEEKHYQSIQQVRKQFAEYMKKNMADRQQHHKQIVELKKDYESRLYDLQQQNQALLSHFQQKNDGSVHNLKKLVLQWENKYSECLSIKDNAENTIKQKGVQNEILSQKLMFLQTSKEQVQRRCQYLTLQVNKVISCVEQKNKMLKVYETRIQDLQKSNQIMKYRVLQLKQRNDPHEHQINQLKANMVEIQEQNQKILQQSHDKEQKIDILKKQRIKMKEQYDALTNKQKKTFKRYEELIDKIRQITKFPIQQVRKELISTLQHYSKPHNSYSVLKQRTQSPLGELNRMRDHLQVCLEQAVTSNKKNQQQKLIEIKKKNHQNSQLLKQINILRTKLKDYEKIIKQKQIHINRLSRGQIALQVSHKDNQIMTKNSGGEKLSLMERQSKSFGKSNTRETTYEKSLFKSSFWKQKRLKTQQGSRRKKSSLSMMREKTQNQLAIAPINQQIEQYRRIIQQKDIFIQKLLSRIQNLN